MRNPAYDGPMGIFEEMDEPIIFKGEKMEKILTQEEFSKYLENFGALAQLAIIAPQTYEPNARGSMRRAGKEVNSAYIAALEEIARLKTEVATFQGALQSCDPSTTDGNKLWCRFCGCPLGTHNEVCLWQQARTAELERAPKESEDPFDKLMAALKKDYKDAVADLACDLFIKNGRCDWANIRLFERKFPDVKIVCLEGDSFGWLIGGVLYNGSTYPYG